MYTDSGAAAEYVCLPYDPNLITNVTTKNKNGDGSYIYGVEYEDNFYGQNLQNKDAPCSVCYTPARSVTLMIPGKTTCYDGWDTEYTGTLASGSYNHAAASQYICLDNKPEVLVENGSADNFIDGKLFYAVKAACGSLPCPPYINNALMTCVVCSK